MKRFHLGWMLCCILSLVPFSFGQTATTSLRGVIRDTSGALVQGASVALSDPATGNSYKAVSNAAGYYIFPILPPAHYDVTVTSSGFATQTRVAELLVDQPATIDFVLSVKAETVNIDVSSSAETLNFTDATIGNSVGNTTIEALPMDLRSPINLLSLQPGVLYMGSEVSDSRQGAVAGGRSDQGNITLDGLDDNDQIFGTAFKGILRSTLDSTEEFRVTTSNGTAASGRSSGAQINLVTKSGTNKFHGALYEYYRPDNVVANQYFLKYNDVSTGSPNTPPFYLVNTFGGSLGGPIFKDKLFFFFNYEGQRIATHDVVGATVPTPNFMSGGLAYVDANTGETDTLTAPQVATMDKPCTTNTFNGAPVCPNGPGYNTAVNSYLSTEPTTLSQIGGDGGLNSGEIFFSSPAPSTLNTSIAKIDYNMNSKNHFFFRGNLQKDTTAGDENFPGQPAATFYDDNTKGMSFGHTWIPTSHIVNDARYGYIRQGWQSGGIAPGVWVDIFGLTQPTAQTGTTSLHVPVNNITDTFTWNKGTHTFAFGGNWRGVTNHHSSNTGSFDGASTNYAYASTGDLPEPSNMASSFVNQWSLAWADLMGVIPELTNVYNYSISGPTTGTALAPGAPVTKNFHANEWEGYVQDTWHARANITLTFGVRYTLLQTPYETHGQQIAPTIDTDAWYKKRESAAQQGEVYEPVISLAPAGKGNHLPGYWPEQKNNFAPRVGIVWAPNGRTTLRASAGMYYDHYGEALVNTFDTVGSYGLTAGITNAPDELGYENSPRFTGPHNLPDIPLPPFSPTQTFPFTPPVDGFAIDWGMDNHIKTPYAESFNVSLQHQLPGGFTLEQAYVGRLGHHLLQELDLAEPTDYVDPGGGGDYFSAARILSKEVDAAPFGYEQYGIFASNTSKQKVNNNIPAIPYFENVFPYMKNADYMGENATQAIFNNAWAPERYTNGETLGLAILDVFGIFPGSPFTTGGASQSTFWSDQFSSLYSMDSIGNSSYNALQFTLRHPASHGLTFDVSYTFSKSLDYGSETEQSNIFSDVDDAYTNFAIQNTWKPKLNKGVSDFDTHSLVTADWVYALPIGRGKALLGSSNRVADALVGGWQFAGLGRWTSGLPFSLESPAYPTNYDNPAMSFNVGGIHTHRNITNGIPHVFDSATAASINSGIYFGNPIRLPYAGEAGDRNVFRGDGYFDIDSSLTKSWNLGDWAKLKFAAEAYNISNSIRFDPSLNGLSGSTANNTVGTYSVALSTYRRMQFGVRVDF
jgi:hypothetical protein